MLEAQGWPSVISLAVGTNPFGSQVEPAGAGFGADIAYRLLGKLAYLDRIVAIIGECADTERFGPGDDRTGDGQILGRRLGDFVVLDHEKDGGAENGGEVQALVHGSLTHRAIAQEDHRDSALVLSRQRAAYRHGRYAPWMPFEWKLRKHRC